MVLNLSQQKATNQEIIAAYKNTGSVWAAAKELGMAGQTVHGRLKALGYPMFARNWSEEEIAELRKLVGQLTISQIADQLGRPYSGVAGMISKLGIGSNFGNRKPIKLPRGAGFDKANTERYAKAIDKSGMTVGRFARANGLRIEFLCASLERHLPEWWEAYRRAHSDLAEIDCEYCGRRFVPSSGKQRLCSRKCGSDQRADKGYFGGNRRKAIGWAEGVCQVCGKTPDKGLTPHHVLGKENDPTDSYLVAVCLGCHNVVTALGGRDFNSQQWEALVSLAWMRRHGPEVAAWDEMKSVSVIVEIDLEEYDEDEEALA